MTNNALAVLDNSDKALIIFDENKIDLIKRTVAKGATDDELALFLHQSQRMGLDPLARQIHFQKYNTKNGPQIAIITGIDGYRLIADRTGCYAGSDEPEFDGRINHSGKDVPAKATVKVWKIVQGKRVPFAASVYWGEYVPDKGRDFQWIKMPHVMLAKCAEAAALRKAFPADLSGAYIHEEMQQAEWFDLKGGDVIEGEVIQETKTRPAEAEAEAAADSQPKPKQARPLSAEAMKTAMEKKTAGKGDKTPSDKQRKYAVSSLAAVASGDNERHTITNYLFGKLSTNDLTASECSALIDWIDYKEVAPDDWQANPDAIMEALAIIRQDALDKGQGELFPD